MEPSIFTKIINGEIPAHKVYEDELTLAFLDIHPIQPGHVLVVPKQQIDHFMDLPDDYYAALWDTVKKVALRLREVFPEKNRIAVIVEGLDVAHAHAKVLPIDNSAELRQIPDMQTEPDHEALAAMAKQITF